MIPDLLEGETMTDLVIEVVVVVVEEEEEEVVVVEEAVEGEAGEHRTEEGDVEDIKGIFGKLIWNLLKMF